MGWSNTLHLWAEKWGRPCKLAKSRGTSPVHRPPWGPKGCLPPLDAPGPRDGSDLPTTWLRPEPKCSFGLKQHMFFSWVWNVDQPRIHHESWGTSMKTISSDKSSCVFSTIISSFRHFQDVLSYIEGYLFQWESKIESCISLHLYVSLRPRISLHPYLCVMWKSLETIRWVLIYIYIYMT